jgi:DNA-binding transcriptional MocR family regulator
MPALIDLSKPELDSLLARTRLEFEALKAQGLSLDMTRGKPSPAQLDLANGMLAMPGNGDFHTAAGEDGRNYGGLQGLPEARALFAEGLDVPPDQIAIAENSSLAVMHDCIVWALLKGVPGGALPWSQAPVTFICPVPGYDRHFALCEEYGIRMLPVPLTGSGPDMDQVEAMVQDPSVKGMWCVPKYANPSGEIYSDEVVQRLATMKTAAPDFRLFWDNAYTAHHLTDKRHPLVDVLALSTIAGHSNRPFIFGSTSKITLAGAGLAFFGGSPDNLRWYLARAGKRTIGPDKLNQIRHVRFLRNSDGLAAHMDAHRRIIAPKFQAVIDTLETRLSGWGIASWTRPEGGYFVTVNAMDGTASRVVTLAKELGVALTPAGATRPGGKDPNDRELRLAPTFPALSDVQAAASAIALCIFLAAVEATHAPV